MKDKSGKVIYTFDDGSLKSLHSSEKLQSRFQIVFFDSLTAGIRNIDGYYLSSISMDWQSKIAGDDETFQLERSDDGYVSFRSFDARYLTVSGDGLLIFEAADSPGDTQLFRITKDCSKKGKNYICRY